MRKSHPTAFTLVELLMVVAIILVLALIGFSVSSKLFLTVRAAKCSNNLRQIGPIVQAIKDEGIHNGWHAGGRYYPPYAGQISTPSPWRKFNIYELIGEQAGFCEFEDGSYQWNTHPSKTFLQNPLSKHELGGDSKTDELNNDNFDTKGGFGYNALIEGWTAHHTPNPKLTTIHAIQFPEVTIIMAEQNPNHTGKPIWMGPWNNVTPAGHYKDSAHCLFVDGHVELLRNDYLASAEGKAKHFDPRKVKF